MDVNASRIHKEVHTALTAPSEQNARRLDVILSQDISLLAKPFETQKPNATDKAKVQSKEVIRGGQKRRLTQDFADQALALSVSLQINELDAVDLLWQAHLLQSRYPDSLVAIAEMNFYANRASLLSALLLIFSQAPTNHFSVDSVIIRFKQELLNQQLFGYMIKEARVRLEQTQRADSSSANVLYHLRNELRLICRLIFMLAHSCRFTTSDAAALLSLVQYSSSLLVPSGVEKLTLRALSNMPSPTDKESSQEPQYSNINATSLLVASFCTYLEPLSEGNHSKYADSDLAAFLRDGGLLEKEIVGNKAQWKHTPIRATLLLTAALSSIMYKQQIDAPFDREERWVKEAIASECFVFIERLAIALREGQELPQIYLKSVAHILVGFLQTLPRLAAELKDQEAESLRAKKDYQNYPYGQEPGEPIRHFEQLLSSLAQVFECLIEASVSPEDWQVQTSSFWDSGVLTQFVRTCGENVFQEMYVPFLRFLRAIAGGSFQARKAHEFLSEKRDYVSWNSFFTAFRNCALAFQKEASSASLLNNSATSNALPPLMKDDVQHLTAMLLLVETIVQYNEQARHYLLAGALSPLEILFALLACPIPPELKAAILSAVRAFAIESTISNRIWQLMGSIQLLPMHPASGGIRAELADIESSNETYPCTKSFTLLLHRLFRVLQTSAGASSSPQELWHYLKFVEKDVLASVDQRSYRRQVEKWELTLESMSLLRDLAFAAQSSFFLQPTFYASFAGSSVSPNDTSAAPGKLGRSSSSFQEITVARLATENPAVLVGIRLISSLLVPDNVVMKKILGLASLGVDFLIEAQQKPGGLVIERCVHAALQIMNVLMECQELLLPNYDLFTKAWSRAVAPAQTGGPQTAGDPTAVEITRAAQELGTAPLMPLDRQLVSQPQGIISLFRLVEYPHNSSLQIHVVRLTQALCSRGECASVVRLLLDNKQQPHLVEAYQCLLDLPGPHPAVFESTDPVSDSILRPLHIPSIAEHEPLRTSVIEMLIACASQPAPNITQLLIGLNPLATPTAGSSQQVVVGDVTALEVTIRLLCDVETHPTLAARCQQLLYTLLLQRPTRNRIATLLRSRQQDFFYTQLFHVALSGSAALVSADRLEALGWLLKLIALELHLTRGTGHMSYTQRLLGYLYVPQTQSDESASSAFTPLNVQPAQQDVQQQRMKMREIVEIALEVLRQEPVSIDEVRRSKLLDGIDLTQATFIDNLKIPLIDHNVLTHLIKERQQLTARSEHDDFGNSAAYPYGGGQIPAYFPTVGVDSSKYEKQLEFGKNLEIVLSDALRVNVYQKTVGALAHTFEGWKEVLSVTLGECFQLIDGSTRTAVLYELQEILLQKLKTLLSLPGDKGVDSIVENHLSRRLGVPMSQCVSLLLAKLRQQMLTSPTNQAPADSHATADAAPAPDQLYVLLDGLVATLSRSENYLQLRLNLYTALLHYVQLVNTIAGDVLAESAVIMHESGGDLIEMIARDACDASGGQKLIPFGLLTVLLPHFDRDGSWLDMLSRNNYIYQFVDQIVRQDTALAMGDARAVYIFESNISMLLAIASTSRRAARVLVENQVLNILSSCSFIEHRPEDRMADSGRDLSAAIVAGVLPEDAEASFERVQFRADTLFQPILRLCQAILVQLERNEEAAAQVASLLMDHSDAVIAVLKDPQSIALELLLSPTTASDNFDAAIMTLTTLALLAGVFRQLAQLPIQARMASKIDQFDRLQLELLAKYATVEERISRGGRLSSSGLTKLRPLIESVLHNLLAYARVRCSAVIPKSANSNSLLLFAATPTGSRNPSVSILLTLLQQSISHIDSVHSRRSDVRSLLVKMNALRVEEITEHLERLLTSGHLDETDLAAQAAIIAPYQSQYRYKHVAELLAGLTAPQRMRLAKRIWTEQEVKLTEQQSISSSNLEHILFLIWKHVSVFLSAAPIGIVISSRERDQIRQELLLKLAPQLDRLSKIPADIGLSQFALKVAHRLTEFVPARAQ